jgi:lipopolysaccharide/colanic/teichoic acid biosynthesis glycosyltransferase
MSRIVAAFLLVLLTPLLAVLVLLVRLSMGRPVLFRQQRSGKDGQIFTLAKFRSMRDASDAAGNPLPDNQRITPLGRLLRRSRLDELPGLWNVITGDIAFVGPRPLLPQTIAKLGHTGHRRGKVKPGLTGWAQVNGNTLLTLEEKVDLDLWYADHANWQLDLSILMRTVWVMIVGERRGSRLTSTR